MHWKCPALYANPLWRSCILWCNIYLKKMNKILLWSRNWTRIQIMHEECLKKILIWNQYSFRILCINKLTDIRGYDRCVWNTWFLQDHGLLNCESRFHSISTSTNWTFWHSKEKFCREKSWKERKMERIYKNIEKVR